MYEYICKKSKNNQLTFSLKASFTVTISRSKKIILTSRHLSPPMESTTVWPSSVCRTPHCGIWSPLNETDKRMWSGSGLCHPAVIHESPGLRWNSRLCGGPGGCFPGNQNYFWRTVPHSPWFLDQRVATHWPAHHPLHDGDRGLAELHRPEF